MYCDAYLFFIDAIIHGCFLEVAKLLCFGAVSSRFTGSTHTSSRDNLNLLVELNITMCIRAIYPSFDNIVFSKNSIMITQPIENLELF